VLACLYDVHGNLPALEAILADAASAGADRFLLGGDYALMGGWPAESVARLRALEPALWIRGNVDRWTADPDSAPEFLHGAIATCAAALGSETTAELGALPETAEIADWMVVHGSPLSDVRGFAPEADDTDEELLAGARPARLMFGHTHVQFTRSALGVELLNPGSVGMPVDGDHRAAYALIGDGVELRRVAYDHAASAAKVRALADGAEWGEVAARRIERAEFVT
jgi:predicted phosphodiesterase